MPSPQRGHMRVACTAAATAGWALGALAGSLLVLGPAGPSVHALVLLAMWLLAVPILASICAIQQRRWNARATAALLAYELGTLHERDLACAMPLR